jgi:hypothetical protein
VSIEDRQRLAVAIRATITDGSPIETYTAQIREQEALARKRALQEEKRREAATRNVAGLPSRKDLAKQVIRDFNATHSWKSIAMLCGGMEHGRFKATWRNEDTASVVPDAPVGQQESDYARDYGATGSWPAKLDKYEAWCLAQHIDKRVDLGERISALRAQLAEQERAQARSRAAEVSARHGDPRQSPSSASLIQAEPTYNEMCDYIESWGAAHGHPSVEIQVDGQTVSIEAGSQAWRRWMLLAVATREQRQAMYEHLRVLE